MLLDGNLSHKMTLSNETVKYINLLDFIFTIICISINYVESKEEN